VGHNGGQSILVPICNDLCRAASFGINFSSANDGWGPYYVNQIGAFGAGTYESAFDVDAADWYEPGTAANSPDSVNFQSPSMGSGSVGIAYASAHPDSGIANGYTWSAYGFANANRYNMQEDTEGNRLTEEVPPSVPPPAIGFHNGYTSWIPVSEEPIVAPDNGIPVSGEHAVLAGFLFASGAGEYGGWSQNDIVVTISGLSSIATEYKVTLLASAQNGGGNPGWAVEGFTPASIMDNASNTDMVEFELLPDRPSFWSPADADPEDNPYVSVAGEAISDVTFTGDALEIRLSGWNEYTTDEFQFFRTTLAGVVIEYEPISTGLEGDHNLDGVVDAADYVFWRDTMGDMERYNQWTANFGAGGGSGSNSAVPEPASWSLMGVALLVVFAARRIRLS
jgi:hypothetical protein